MAFAPEIFLYYLVMRLSGIWGFVFVGFFFELGGGGGIVRGFYSSLSWDYH